MRRTGDVPGTTAINVEELARGLREGEQAQADALLSGLRILPVTESVARLAGGWRRQLATRGVTIGQADCLIAAAAAEAAARLATGNPDDFPMPGLSVEHWPVGI